MQNSLWFSVFPSPFSDFVGTGKLKSFHTSEIKLAEASAVSQTVTRVHTGSLSASATLAPLLDLYERAEHKGRWARMGQMAALAPVFKKKLYLKGYIHIIKCSECQTVVKPPLCFTGNDRDTFVAATPRNCR